ncbi:uncharacterized protein EDB91DRAFT_1088291 [Suillus paluster]|uniref:uncharacterized protein n=1 Tax=Suillus paluster TaxID=48578 RepID=UPI001B87838C|nr:uncharacterized protein EDB91DRAFT_1088291 [Suillus paluster]KAG1721935.1 hypothetical protein EDB91DRAFT_1088291 [Suillus paluster]
MLSMAGISEGTTKFTGTIELNNKGKSFTTVGVAPQSPFASALEDMIQEQYDRADDRLDSDDEGDELTRDVNMRRVIRRQPAHDHDAGEEDEYSREQRLVERIDEIEAGDGRLNGNVANGGAEGEAECATWDDSISERKRTVNRRMDNIADIAETNHGIVSRHFPTLTAHKTSIIPHMSPLRLRRGYIIYKHNTIIILPPFPRIVIETVPIVPPSSLKPWETSKFAPFVTLFESHHCIPSISKRSNGSPRLIILDNRLSYGE